jgi:hypothetical protein
MSSAVRAYAAPREGITRFLKPESPCYDIGDGNNTLFPFSYSNGVLDITYEGNNFESLMVDISGNSPNSETETSYRITGVPKLVTSLGNNFKAYIRAWRMATIDSGSAIELVQPSQVVRVQQANLSKVSANSGESWLISSDLPLSDFYVTGATANEYQTTYIFKTPLTFSIVESSVTKYITFRTIMDQE